MTKRRVKFKETADVVPCPKCGNKTEFTIHSDYCAEDCCEVWVVCKCGYEPDSGNRFEDVWGGCHDDNVIAAISCWNEAMMANAELRRAADGADINRDAFRRRLECRVMRLEDSNNEWRKSELCLQQRGQRGI